MTTTEQPLLPETAAERPSRYDAWRARVAGDPRLQRLYGWLAPVLITVLAAVLRLADAGAHQVGAEAAALAAELVRERRGDLRVHLGEGLGVDVGRLRHGGSLRTGVCAAGRLRCPPS